MGARSEVPVLFTMSSGTRRSRRKREEIPLDQWSRSPVSTRTDTLASDRVRPSAITSTVQALCPTTPVRAVPSAWLG